MLELNCFLTVDNMFCLNFEYLLRNTEQNNYLVWKDVMLIVPSPNHLEYTSHQFVSRVVSYSQESTILYSLYNYLHIQRSSSSINQNQLQNHLNHNLKLLQALHTPRCTPSNSVGYMHWGDEEKRQYPQKWLNKTNILEPDVQLNKQKEMV